MSKQLEATPPHGQVPPGFPTPSPGQDKPFDRGPTSEPAEAQVNGAHSTGNRFENGTNYIPKRLHQTPNTHGGILVKNHGDIGSEVARLIPNVPTLDEMGVIDIRALSLSVQSGIHSEVRLALDYLVRLSMEPRVQFELERCEDLLDILIDCGEDQIEMLAEGAKEVQGAFDMQSYEAVVRNARIELSAVQNVPDFGSTDYELERCADRVISITTILRNLSFYEFNHHLLSGSHVVKFIARTMHFLGSRQLLLRTHANTVDFMKDTITFLSNTTHTIELPSRDDALSMMHFLIAFAPCPPPSSNPIRFTPYNPAVHRYLPSAVDCLAKLLARDDPNRAYYKQIFSTDSGANLHYDLLTRAFALAISVVPDRTTGKIAGRNELKISEARKPYLTQGMLAADILASLAPGPETGIARAWLEAEDGWAPSLIRFVTFLFSAEAVPAQQQPQQPPARGAPPPRQDDRGYELITHRALAMLKRLGEKCGAERLALPGSTKHKDAKDAAAVDGQQQQQPRENGDKAPEDGAVAEKRKENGVPVAPIADGDAMDEDAAYDSIDDEERIEYKVKADLVPKKEMLMGAMMTPSVDPVALKTLLKFADLIE
jgi:SWI/SNF chromatin-remodeling complex subunit SWI1